MATANYSMAFTTAALLYHECLAVEKLYRELQDWKEVRSATLEGNLLQKRTRRASERIFSEVASRLQLLTPGERNLLLEGDRPEQQYLLWLAVCKRYAFIYEFAVEVLREKFLRLDFWLTNEEYEVFFFDKAALHPKLDTLAERTRTSQRQFLFKMMHQAELLTDDNRIIPALLSPRLVEVIVREDPRHLSVFPAAEVDMQWNSDD